jgi:hypothetical protein
MVFIRIPRARRAVVIEKTLCFSIGRGLTYRKTQRFLDSVSAGIGRLKVENGFRAKLALALVVWP